MPTVSVLIPNYNRSLMLQDAIQSVLAQSYQDFEIIVVDDGSTEDIPSAIAPFADRVQYVRKENAGCASARNHGLGLVKGEFTAFLDNDDLWLPQKLERQVEVLQSRPDVGMVSCQAYVMDDSARVFARPAQGADRVSPLVSLAELSEQNVIVGGGSSEIVRTQALRDIGGFNSTVEFVDDWDCWLRLGRQWQIWMVPEPLSYYRLNSQGFRNHAPLPAQADRVHANILRVLRQTFESWPDGHGDPSQIRARAYAREYLRHALVLYAHGRQADGRSAWEKAIRFSPQIATNPALVTSALINCATGYALGVPAAQRAILGERILEGILSDLPEEMSFLEGQRGKLEATLLAEMAFLAAQQGDVSETRALAWQCLARDPAWARNIGLLKLIADGGRRHWPEPVQDHMARFS
jgi:glycosyltransferase involved in cell wall biosynthesis